MTGDEATLRRDRRLRALVIGGLALGFSLIGSTLTAVAPAAGLERAGYYATPGGLYAVSVLIFELDIVLLVLIGLLIFIRLPANRVGWLLVAVGAVGAVLVVTQAYVLHSLGSEPATLPAAEPVAWLLNWSGAALFVLAIAALLLFPTGRALSRTWARAFGVTLVVFVIAGAGYALAPGPMPLTMGIANPFGVPHLASVPTDVRFFAFLLSGGALALVAAASTIARFRRGSRIERLQLKWVAVAATFLAVSFLLLGSIRNPWDELGDVLFYLALTTLPSAVAIAILRYHLYAIDVIIRRTLVYGALSACLGAAYAVGVVAFQAVLDPITGGQGLAIAAATLLVASAFRPVRSWLQDVIDRRFNRLHYDAARTVANLTTRLRDEVELVVIERDILTTVQGAVEPTAVALWQRRPRPPGREGPGTSGAGGALDPDSRVPA